MALRFSRGRGTSLITLALLSLAACGNPEPGVIAGTAFLAHDLDRQVDLPGLHVHLLREEVDLDSILGRVCPRRAGNAAAAPEQAAARAWSERARILTGLRERTATASAQSQFTLDSVAPGRYHLWADTTVGDDRWTWLQDVTVRGGDTVRIDLTNANPDENPFRCRE